MRRTLLFILLLVLTQISLAEDAPSLTSEGLETYKLGQVAPASSDFVGLTTKRVEKVEYAEGEAYRNVYLKFFLHGHYLGRAHLNADGRIHELDIVSSKVRYEGGFAVGDDLESVARVFPRNKLHYAFLLDAIVMDSESVPGFQVLFPNASYRGKKPLVGEWMPLPESEMDMKAKVKAIRLFKLLE